LHQVGDLFELNVKLPCQKFTRVGNNTVLTSEQKGLTANATLHSAYIYTTHDTLTY